MIPMRGHSLIEAQSFYELEAFVDNVKRFPLLSLDEDVTETINRPT